MQVKMSNDNEVKKADLKRQPIKAENSDAGSALTVRHRVKSLQVKMPEEQESKITGLSKKKLLEVSRRPGWVRARLMLLILCGVGWLCMLAYVFESLKQAPPCKPLPEINWWDFRPLYQIGDVEAFVGPSGLKGLEAKVGTLGQLKVKGLIVGPIHVSTADQPDSLKLMEIIPSVGNLTDLEAVITSAHRKGISVVLDLTPNYRGSEPWFSNTLVTKVAEKVKVAAEYWLTKGVDGILLYGVDHVAGVVPSFWTSIREIVSNHTTREKKKVLIGATKATSSDEVYKLLKDTGVDLLLSNVLRYKFGAEFGEVVQNLYSRKKSRLAWNLGHRAKGHLANMAESLTIKMHQMLLLTLPGTPIFNYGDEIGLKDGETVFPVMIWDTTDTNDTKTPEVEQRKSLRTFFKTVSDLRGKERSLLHGDYVPLYNDTTTLAFLRVWDQSECYVAAFNWSPNKQVTLQLKHEMLPEKATIIVDTKQETVASGQSINLALLVLEPKQAVLLKFSHRHVQ